MDKLGEQARQTFFDLAAAFAAMTACAALIASATSPINLLAWLA